MRECVTEHNFFVTKKGGCILISTVYLPLLALKQGVLQIFKVQTAADICTIW